jgi:tetratricopeptide (TPR) repeat protein
MRLITTLLALISLAACTGAKSADGSGAADTLSLFELTELGTVDLPVSCNEAASAGMEHGLALLHHMAYTEANLVFRSVLVDDPSCAMAYWGSAMTLFHPWWPDSPTDAELDQGAALVEQARGLGPMTERERAYIDAVGAYFRDGTARTEEARLHSFYEGWRDVHSQFPEDWEATAFYVLAGAAPGVGGVPRSAGGKLMETLLGLVPDHPGGQHYLIHAYDSPEFASGALEVARSYGELAPRVPHALHMPTHIYTQLGLWPESVELNELSAAAASEQGPLVDGIDIAYGHPLGYLIYAYLQRGQDAEAEAVRDRALSVEGPFSALNLTTFAAHLAAIPVRYALERHEWEEAAALGTRLAAGFPWEDGFTEYDAVTYFGRAIGHARSGNAVGARVALEQLRTALAATTGPLLSANGPALLLSAEAWAAYADGDVDSALETMVASAEAASSVTWAGLSEILPAGELLADMYLDLGRHADALAAYDDVLERQPHRLNSLCGAARAAELVGELAETRSYYRTLGRLTDSESTRGCLKTGRAFLDAG